MSPGRCEPPSTSLWRFNYTLSLQASQASMTSESHEKKIFFLANAWDVVRHAWDYGSVWWVGSSLAFDDLLGQLWVVQLEPAICGCLSYTSVFAVQVFGRTV